ncbi:hypothetical protein FLM48_17100 [Shewanella sp. Scap07]|uniref:hypothetical protein n=1 Tax=Shewanella sp. Scap07 TaxID=2589987 RepID=UPI0015BF684F|nr:hypothetical protein [Shewanella sp. Scap07]QLE86637.1 hypothetical protein FLM48_17100 [Shewanella sp. Scap07]
MNIEDISVSEFVPKLKYVFTVVSGIMAAIFCYTALAILLSFVLFPYENIEEIGPRYVAIMSGVLPIIGIGVGLSFGRLWARTVIRGLAIVALLVSLASVVVVVQSSTNSTSHSQWLFITVCGFFALMALILSFSKLFSTSLHVMRRHRRRRKKAAAYLKNAHS